MTLDEALLELIRRAAGEKTPPDIINEKIFYALANWRASKLAMRLIEKSGTKVLSGPFQGLDFPISNPLSCYAPKLLGVYELELHGFINEALRQNYEAIVNIGCAEGYYALGFALKIPKAEIYAHDIDEGLQKICRSLAERNGVLPRTHTGGLFEGARFASFADKHTLVFCDIEGAEKELLDPNRYPALKQMDMIVECHECFVPGLRDEFNRRFESSHAIRWAEPQLRWGNLTLNLPGLEADDLDLCLMTYENRGGPTPWGYFRSKANA